MLLVIRKERIAEFDAILQTVLADKEKVECWLCFTDDQGWLRRVLPKAILGWYFRPHTEDSSAKAVAIMERMEKKMPDGNEGEAWKQG
jgi:hypothetical protein